MKKLLLTSALALPLCADALAQPTVIGPGNAIICNKIANLAAGPVVMTQVIAPVTGQIVAFCGWHVTNTGTTGTFSFSYGTGSNCGTGTNTFLTAQNVSSNAPSADHSGYASFNAPASNAICVTPSVATIATTVFYAQF